MDAELTRPSGGVDSAVAEEIVLDDDDVSELPEANGSGEAPVQAYAGWRNADTPSGKEVVLKEGVPRLEVTREPAWTKQPGEKARQHEAFKLYLSLGPLRSHRQLLEELHAKGWKLSGTTIGQYSSFNLWTSRANEYDEHNALLAARAHDEAIVNAVERHVESAIALQEIGGERLEQLRDELASLSPAEARAYVVEGVKLERLSLGLSTESRRVEASSVVKREVSQVEQLLREDGAVDMLQAIAERLAEVQQRARTD